MWENVYLDGRPQLPHRGVWIYGRPHIPLVEGNGESIKDSKPGTSGIKFISYKDFSAYRMDSGLEGGKQKVRSRVRRLLEKSKELMCSIRSLAWRYRDHA